MKPAAIAVCAALLSVARPAGAHRLDEYLQATLVSIERDRVELHITLTPGVAVLPLVLAAIDSDHDGVISESEQRAYAARVQRDLSLTAGSGPLTLRVLKTTFPKIEEMKEGLGEIELAFTAGIPSGGGNRKLVFENRHQSRIAAYQVNCLVPRDPEIRIASQTRNYLQSSYRLDYVQPAGTPQSLAWLGTLAALFAARLAFIFCRTPRTTSSSLQASSRESCA